MTWVSHSTAPISQVTQTRQGLRVVVPKSKPLIWPFPSIQIHLMVSPVNHGWLPGPLPPVTDCHCDVNLDHMLTGLSSYPYCPRSSCSLSLSGF